MIYSRQYSRLTLALKGIVSASSDGRCIIEIRNSKGRLIFNTYSIPKDKTFSACFVMKGNPAKAIPVGEVSFADPKNVYFDPDDINGKKIEDAAAVVLINSDSNVPLTAGYINEPMNLQKGVSIAKAQAKPREEQSKKDAPTEVKEVLSPQKTVSKKQKEMPKVDFMEMFDKFRKEMHELEQMAAEKTNKKEPADNISDIVQNTIKAEEIAEKSCTDNKHTNYIEYIEKKRETGEQYIENNDNAKWYKVAPAELSAIQDVPLNIMTDPACIEGYEKYGCILLGICPDNKYMVGVISEVPASQNSPFKQTIPLKDDSLMCLVYTCS